ncbi:MAG: HPr family phosphocarrier protein [Hyphomicrobiales bacterium]|nr:MAG: HPr family phosphocarrier protein [Hyphomicrobiales bacterium]
MRAANTSTSPARSWETDVSALSKEFAIINQRGLHARASAKFVKCAEGFDANITVTRDGQTVPATSIMGLMMLAAAMGTSIIVEASGPQAEAAMAALEALVASRFDEE